MAEEIILPNAVPGGELPTLTGNEILVVHKPAGTTSGWQDHFITSTNFLKSVVDGLAASVASVIALALRVTVLENLTKKTINLNKNSAYTFNTIDSDSVIDAFCIKWVAGSPSVKVGTTLGGTEIMTTKTVTNATEKDKIKHVIVNYPFTGSTTVFVTVTGGTVHIVRFYKDSLFT